MFLPMSVSSDGHGGKMRKKLRLPVLLRFVLHVLLLPVLFPGGNGFVSSDVVSSDEQKKMNSNVVSSSRMSKKKNESDVVSSDDVVVQPGGTPSGAPTETASGGDVKIDLAVQSIYELGDMFTKQGQGIGVILGVGPHGTTTITILVLLYLITRDYRYGYI